MASSSSDPENDASICSVKRTLQELDVSDMPSMRSALESLAAQDGAVLREVQGISTVLRSLLASNGPIFTEIQKTNTLLETRLARDGEILAEIQGINEFLAFFAQDGTVLAGIRRTSKLLALLVATTGSFQFYDPPGENTGCENFLHDHRRLVEAIRVEARKAEIILETI